MVHVVQEMDLVAAGLPDAGEEFRDEIEIPGRVPEVFPGQSRFGGLVGGAAVGNAVGMVDTRDAGLDPHRPETGCGRLVDPVDGFFRVTARDVGVHHDPVPALSPDQVVDRRAQDLSLDVPEGGIDGRNGGHVHSAAFPVGAFVEIMPDVFDVRRVPADQRRQEVILKTTRHGFFTAVQGGVAQAVHSPVGHDFQGDEIPARAGDDDFGVGDFHARSLPGASPDSVVRNRNSASRFHNTRRARFSPADQCPGGRGRARPPLPGDCTGCGGNTHGAKKTENSANR